MEPIAAANTRLGQASEAPQATIGAERCGQNGQGGSALRLGWAREPSAVAIPYFKENIVNYLRKQLLGKMHIWEVAAFSSWGSCHLGSCHLGKYTFGKLPLGKLHIWEVATWKNTIGKLMLGKSPLGKYLTSKHKTYLDKNDTP